VRANAQRGKRAANKVDLAGKVRGCLRDTHYAIGVIRGYFSAKPIRYAA
jgi:hypothetical protein